MAQGYAVAAYLEDGSGRRLCTVVTAYLVDGSDLGIYVCTSVHCTSSATYLGAGCGFRMCALCSCSIY